MSMEVPNLPPPDEELLPVKMRGGLNVYARTRGARAKRAFLKAYARVGIITWAAEIAHVGSRHTIYSWLEHDPEFAAAFNQAQQAAVETLEREAWRRAVEGSPYTRTSYWHGEPVGTDSKIEYSDALMTLLLKARAPERYRESTDITVTQVIKTVSGVDPSDVL